MTDIPSPERAPMTDEQPSKEALKAASAALNDGLRKFRKRYFDFDLSDIARAEIAASFALALDRFAAARVREERERGNALRATAEAVRSSIFYWMIRNHHRGERAYARLGEAKESLTEAIKKYDASENPRRGISRQLRADNQRRY